MKSGKQHSNIEKILKNQTQNFGDLVTLDFKSESLNKFLENIVQLVNQHTKRINQIQNDKISIQDINQGHAKLYKSSKLPPTFLNELHDLQRPKSETYPQLVEAISNNFSLNSEAFKWLYENLRKKDQKIAEIEANLLTLEKAENAKEQLRKNAVTSKKYTDDETNKVLNRVKELEMKTNKKISQFQNSNKQIQKKTLWKITQCQNSLLKKITSEYVQKSLEQLQSKIHNDIKNNKNQQINQMKFNLETQRQKIEALTKDHQQKQKQNKQWLKQLQQGAKLLQNKEKSDQQKRDIQFKIRQLLLKIDKLQKRQDPQDVELRINKNVLQLKEKHQNTSAKVKKIQSQLQTIQNIMSSLNVGDGGMDPHKLCYIDGQVKRLRDANRSNESRLQFIQEQMKTKLIVFQQRVMTALSMLKSQDNFVSRDQLYQSLGRLRQPVTQRLTQNQNLIHQINGKVNKLELFEKATKRKIKQLTRGDELNKILDMKLNVSQAQTQFNAISMKLQNLEIILNKTKMDVDASSGFLRLLQDQINQPEEGINIIGPKQKVFPAKCLGCGTKHIPQVFDNNMMMGTDGKYYRVDLRNSYTTDQKQVYGVTPSQIAVYETTTKKPRINSAVSRSNCSRTNMRPISASRL